MNNKNIHSIQILNFQFQTIPSRKYYYFHGHAQPMYKEAGFSNYLQFKKFQSLISLYIYVKFKLFDSKCECTYFKIKYYR